MVAKNKNPDALVEMVDIHKYFGSVQVLRGLDFHVGKQEIVGLLGDNGAGKSTLIKVLTGFHTPTKGQIFFDGDPVDIVDPHAARTLGIETVYQDLALVPLMSIARNFWLGQEPTYNVGPFKLIDKKKMGEEAIAALLDVGIHIRNSEEIVGTMSGGERQSIAIGRAVYFGKKLLILDEPTSALSVGETQKVLDYTIAAKEKGMSVIFITHNIRHVFEVADRFTIIERGRKLGDFKKEDVEEKEVANMIIDGSIPERLRLFDNETAEAGD
ncbi:MAG: ATP-binding cassette domain-containing protein [Aggregatilineales bacterium]